MFVTFLQRSVYSALSFYFLDSDLRRDDSIDEIEVTLICILFFHYYKSVGDDSLIFFFKEVKKNPIVM